MNILTLILLLVISYFIAWHINFFIDCRKLYKLIIKLNDLEIYFFMYCNRKEFLKEKNLSYDTVFSYNYECTEYKFKSKMSQKEFIKDLYEQINTIDCLIKDLPNGLLENKVQNFYNLRRQIRTEKLYYENSTY